MKLPTPKQLPSGAWYVQCMVDGHRQGRTFPTEREAILWAAEVKAKAREISRMPGALTVGQAIDRYIESRSAVLSPSTICGYRRLRKNTLQSIMPVRVNALTQEQVQRAINDMARTHSPKSCRNAHGLLTATLALYRPALALHTALPAKARHEIAIPSAEEIALLAQELRGKWFELPFLLAVWCGLRTSEIRGLTWDCLSGDVLHIKQAIVDAEDGPVLKATKTYSGNRKIRLPEYLLTLIEAQPRTSEFIVPCTRSVLYNRFNRLCAKHGLPHYRFHDLRHVQASVMLALNVPDKYAMERMGHASTNMLKNVYQHTMAPKSVEIADQIDAYFSKLIE